MKNFYYRIPSTHAVTNALISRLQIDYYTIHKIQPLNIETKPSQKRKEIIESTLFFRISLRSFYFPAISIFSSVTGGLCLLDSWTRDCRVKTQHNMSFTVLLNTATDGCPLNKIR